MKGIRHLLIVYHLSLDPSGRFRQKTLVLPENPNFVCLKFFFNDEEIVRGKE